MACLVRMQDETLLLDNCRDNSNIIIYSVDQHDFESPLLWDVNCLNSYSSLARF